MMNFRQHLLIRKATRAKHALPWNKQREGRALLRALLEMLADKEAGHVGRAVGAGERDR
ncbi:hypothetical protein [Chromobacterium violaceum]|uniref:hypothetical protein n=1 Tax=Chromobacterium violaceum TaxID=536 RepID=UPI0015F96B9C|nr:hypothetical protein [Chromobacterium violaceum]MBA8734212.1 hypothetical protein [Chromobacterium violaceum]